RKLPFSPEALARAACDALGASHVTRFDKLAEGLSNRVFLLSLNTGKDVVARLTFCNPCPAHVSNVSETATLDFLSHLGISVPQVYTHSAKDDVGAPYMLTSLIPGVELTSRLGAFRASPGKLIDKLVSIPSKLAQTRFAAYGALYFRKDVPPLLEHGCGSREMEDRWALGPSVHRVFWGERAGLNIDRGPWHTIPSLAQALAKAEQAHITARSTSSDSHSPKALKALAQFLRITPFLAPREEEARAACLLHPDLHAGNVFVNPEGEVEMTGIIDWQGAGIGPLYVRAPLPPKKDSLLTQPCV
ncbi:hypothetical protein DACRYDRAFT_60097, partial [Dacryopinax primogenitus]